MMTPVNASIIICAFNEERTLAACLESLKNTLVENPDVELIVMDNESSDSTPEIIDAFFEKNKTIMNISFFRIEHTSLAASRNTGIHYARGKYIVFLDADTEVTENWLSAILKGFENKSVAMVSGKFKVLNHTSRVANFLFYSCYEPCFETSKSKLVGANMAFRKEVFDVTGGFYENLGFRGDETCLINSYSLLRPNDTEYYSKSALVFHELEESVFVSLRNRYIEGKSGSLLLKLFRSNYASSYTIILRFINIICLFILILTLLLFGVGYIPLICFFIISLRYLYKFKLFKFSFLNTYTHLNIGYAFLSIFYLFLVITTIDLGYIYSYVNILFVEQKLKNAAISNVMLSKRHSE